MSDTLELILAAYLTTEAAQQDVDAALEMVD